MRSRAGEGARERRALVLLALGAGIGLLAAAFELVGSGADPAALPDAAVARVNGMAIEREAYLRLVEGFEQDRRDPLDDADRRHVLDRMIDEELLVQRGLELGLARYDRRVRADLTSALIATITAVAERRPPTDDELRDFYRENADFFTRPGRLRVRQILFRVSPGRPEAESNARAGDALERLRAGESFEAVRQSTGDEAIAPVPDTLLPATKLREYLGPTALRAALALEPGEVSEPVRSGTGLHVLELVDREPERTPAFDQIREQVRAEWVRRRGDTALRSYLADLRARSDILVSAELE